MVDRATTGDLVLFKLCQSADCSGLIPHGTVGRLAISSREVRRAIEDLVVAKHLHVVPRIGGGREFRIGSTPHAAAILLLAGDLAQALDKPFVGGLE